MPSRPALAATGALVANDLALDRTRTDRDRADLRHGPAGVVSSHTAASFGAASAQRVRHSVCELFPGEDRQAC